MKSFWLINGICVALLLSACSQSDSKSSTKSDTPVSTKTVAGASATGNAISSEKLSVLLPKNDSVTSPVETIQVPGNLGYGSFLNSDSIPVHIPKQNSDSLSTLTQPKTSAKAIATQKNTDFIDADGDDYGVGAPKGPDADDSNPSIHKFDSTQFQSWLKSQKINYERCWFIQNSFNQNTQGIRGNLHKPFSSFQDIQDSLQTGDAIFYREGVYTSSKIFPSSNSLKQKKSVLISAWPGEKVEFIFPQSIHLQNIVKLIIQNISVRVPESSQSGVILKNTDSIVLRNMNFQNNGLHGLVASSNKSLRIENSVFCNNNSGDGVLILSATRSSSENITIKNNRFCNNANGIHIEGTGSNYTILNNIFRANRLSGILMSKGPENSFITKNLFVAYKKSGIRLETKNRNTVFHKTRIQSNTIWPGLLAGAAVTGNALELAFGDSDPGFLQIKNNILVSQNVPALSFEHWNLRLNKSLSVEIQKNILYCQKCSNEQNISLSNDSTIQLKSISDFEESSTGFSENKSYNPSEGKL